MLAELIYSGRIREDGKGKTRQKGEARRELL
jgi:hypothetical protein